MGVRAPEKVRAPACTPGFADGGRPSRRQQIRPRTSRAKLEAVRGTELAKLCVCVKAVCVNLGQELLKL